MKGIYFNLIFGNCEALTAYSYFFSLYTGSYITTPFRQIKNVKSEKVIEKIGRY